MTYLWVSIHFTIEFSKTLMCGVSPSLIYIKNVKVLKCEGALSNSL